MKGVTKVMRMRSSNRVNNWFPDEVENEVGNAGKAMREVREHQRTSMNKKEANPFQCNAFEFKPPEHKRPNTTKASQFRVPDLNIYNRNRHSLMPGSVNHHAVT